MGLIIAGERSGVGKTTITLALLSFLARQRERVQSFKVGPDYIDPMFHREITRRPCRNLDPVLTSPEYVQTCYSRHSRGMDAVVVEGVMGLFDGVPLQENTAYASTAHIAKLLHLPVVLVIDCSRLSGSVAAIVQGYATLDPAVTLAGVVLNRVGSDRHLTLLQNALESRSIPILGVFYRNPAISLPDRHLGLIPTDELSPLHPFFDQLADLAQTSFNWEKLTPLLSPSSVEQGTKNPPPITKNQKPTTNPRIAVAKDQAFNFYYQDNLDLLQDYGAELVFWSPLTDTTLPPNTHGLYLGGGFPEIFAEALEANETARSSLYHAIQDGLPTYGECGGLMYLCNALVDLNGDSWNMVGSLPTTTQMQKRLTLGYRHATVKEPSPVVQVGQRFWGHEFHHSTLTQPPQIPLYSLTSYRPDSPQYAEGWTLNNVHASYLHLHWGGIPTLPQQFVATCGQFASSN
ncbi:cobyrinate a,c-diamide synthase [Spirulina sp. CS-785/01]|uniref:cobyrinate a,c-diamide synthase n=1 Tax=Spirulina sp. CS-785/01 TaxID=3021716 RepID=UPI0023315A41|nr:cobyrinate a,c-diamide synthase [Spirulina sp. CS-785/01]MDB9315338.1 cobyrinate a,c-diamide synthase [Spirulina sp. CS-785/01]